MSEHEKILGSARNIIMSFSDCNIQGCSSKSLGLTILEQDSIYHLRFIPQCLDIDFLDNRKKENENYILITKKGNFLPNEVKENGKTPIKRDTYLEFAYKKNFGLELLLVTFSPEIVEKVKKIGFNVKKANNNCFHIEPKKILSLKTEFKAQTLHLLKILDKVYS